MTMKAMPSRQAFEQSAPLQPPRTLPLLAPPRTRSSPRPDIPRPCLRPLQGALLLRVRIAVAAVACRCSAAFFLGSIPFTPVYFGPVPDPSKLSAGMLCGLVPAVGLDADVLEAPHPKKILPERLALTPSQLPKCRRSRQAFFSYARHETRKTCASSRHLSTLGDLS